jgi:hypothetical protein
MEQQDDEMRGIPVLSFVRSNVLLTWIVYGPSEIGHQIEGPRLKLPQMHRYDLIEEKHSEGQSFFW